MEEGKQAVLFLAVIGGSGRVAGQGFGELKLKLQPQGLVYTDGVCL